MLVATGSPTQEHSRGAEQVSLLQSWIFILSPSTNISLLTELGFTFDGNFIVHADTEDDIHMWKDFKAFIARGNVLDLAIGVIIGAAFTSIVKTFTDGLIMPFVSLILGGVDFRQKVWNLGSMPVTNAAEIEAAQKAKEPLVLYGQLINDVITFLIVALVMFLLARYAVHLFRIFEAESVPDPKIELMTEIRDILKAK